MGEIIFDINKNPYCTYNLYTKSQIIIKSGITVLVGCNGSGKTTLLRTIKEHCEKSNLNVIKWDNLKDGGSNANDKLGYIGDTKSLMSNITSSEGEQIYNNFGRMIRTVGNKVRIMDTNKDNKLFLLVDALDSGLSIDNIDEVKEFFHDILIKDCEEKGIELYIIIVANEYEMAYGENCFDVRHGKYRRFKNYEYYKKFILASREEKNNSVNKYIYKSRREEEKMKSNLEIKRKR